MSVVFVEFCVCLQVDMVLHNNPLSHDRLSWIKSSLFSREQTFESMSDGIAGLMGLALSLARIPPLLPCFCSLSHRRRRETV